MTIRDTLSLIYTDYRRYRHSERTGAIRTIFFTQGFWAGVVYRVSHWSYYSLKIPVLRQILNAFFFLCQKGIEIVAGIRLPAKCHIGKGLYIGHFNGIIINNEAQIGNYCNISQGMTIGITWGGKHPGVPVIGNRVYIGPNAIVIGGIHIGDDVAIGAGAVVTKSLPPRAVVVGNPAKIISYRGSFDYVGYDKMESDPERITSLMLRDDHSFESQKTEPIAEPVN